MSDDQFMPKSDPKLPSRAEMADKFKLDWRINREAVIDLMRRRDEMVVEFIARKIETCECLDNHAGCHDQDAADVRALKDKLK